MNFQAHPGVSAPRLRQAWQLHRGEVAVCGGVFGALSLIGAVLAVVWWWWAPQLDVVVSSRGVLINVDQPEQYITSDGRFGFIVALTGVVTGLAVWFIRRFRGWSLLLALALGALAGSWVMWQLGEEIGATNVESIVSAMTLGDRGHIPIVELNSLGLLFLQPLLAVLTYVVCVSWSSTPDLRPTAPGENV
ncbi:MAG: hypothetical protein ACRDPW_11205 [Mycobacteriales bacterium]